VDSDGNELSRLSADSTALAIKEQLYLKTEKQLKAGWVLTLKGPLNTQQRRSVEKAAISPCLSRQCNTEHPPAL
jgi:hypothetical protein